MPRLLLLLVLAASGCLPAPQSDTGLGSGDDTGTVDDVLTLDGRIVRLADTETTVEEVSVGLLFLEYLASDVYTADALVLLEGLTLEDETTFELELPLVVDDALLSDLVEPGLRGAEFVLGAWEDNDGDGLPDEDEAMVGASTQTLVFLTGELDTTLEELGFGLGWNLVTRDLLGEAGVEGGRPLEDGSALRIDTNLLPMLPRVLAGSVADTTLPSLVSAVDFVGQCEGTARQDTFHTTGVADGGFSFDWPRVPPSTEWDTTELLDDCGNSPEPILGVRGAVFDLVHFHDNNLDGDFSPGVDDVVARSSSVGGDSSVLVYLWATDLTAMAYAQQGGGMGWQRIAIGGLGSAPFLEWSGVTLQ